MPRWLSEGISVYEERQADSGWGEALNQRYRDMLLNERTPVSELSGAFLRPASPLHLQFAYFESSLVVEFLLDQYGQPALLNVLDELAEGTPIADALRRHAEPVEVIDQRFDEFAEQRAREFAPDADWTKPAGLPAEPGLADWQGWVEQHPKNLPGLIALSAAYLEAGQPAEALVAAQQAAQQCPDEPAAWQLQARCFRDLDQPQQERQALDTWAALDADDVNLYLRLLELTTAAEDWEATERYAHRLVAVNPLIKPPYLALADAAEARQSDALAVAALQSLMLLEPIDPVGARYRLATAHFRLGQWEPAKREVLRALEEAPRFREAHQLLLKILEQQERP